MKKVRLSEDEEIPEVPEIELPIVLIETGKELDLPEKQKEKLLSITENSSLSNG